MVNGEYMKRAFIHYCPFTIRQYKSATQQKLNAYSIAWLKKFIYDN